MQRDDESADVARYHRRRWVARIATLVVGAHGVSDLVLIIQILHAGGDTRFGILAYLGFLGDAAAVWCVVRPSWRRSFEARAAVLARYQLEDEDVPSGWHVGLHDGIEPPRRW